ncbi:MAG: SDR family oxidoreductase [Anaerolineae bacterium]
MNLKPLDEQVVVVFGASSGIGREASLRFAARGARVVVSARDENGLNSLVEEIQADGGQAVPVTADAVSREQVRAVAERAVQEYGHLDTWVHAASVILYASFEDTTPEEFRQVIDINLMGAVHGAKAALTQFKREGRGSLILVSSVEGYVAFPLQAAYAASKAGVVALADALRLEVKHDGFTDINIADIVPSSINTPIFDTARTKIGAKPQGVPPFYHPALAAEAILYAAEHPVRDLVVGGGGRALITTKRMSNRAADAFLGTVAFRGMKTDEPKSRHAPDNLRGPLEGYDDTQGTLNHAIPFSPYTWLQMHPMAKRVLGMALLGGTAYLAVRRLRDHDGQGAYGMDSEMCLEEPIEEAVIVRP